MVQADVPAAVLSALLAFNAANLAAAFDGAGWPGVNGAIFREPTTAQVAMARMVMQLTDAPGAAKVRAMATLIASGQPLPYGIA